MARFLHTLADAKALFEILGAEKNLPPVLIEKDYWVMHCLWGLQQNGFRFEMKGGTSLSKGWGCIDRFSEDIDIRFESPTGLNVKAEKPSPIKARFAFYDSLAAKIKIPGVTVERNRAYDDEKISSNYWNLSESRRLSERRAIKPTKRRNCGEKMQRSLNLEQPSHSPMRRLTAYSKKNLNP
jgi:hypothetical protein